jgi:hypothetical protein
MQNPAYLSARPPPACRVYLYGLPYRRRTLGGLQPPKPPLKTQKGKIHQAGRAARFGDCAPAHMPGFSVFNSFPSVFSLIWLNK